MASEFSLNDGPVDGTNSETGNIGVTEPASTSGTPDASDGNSGVEGGNSGIEGIAADLTKSGTVRKRRAGGGRKPGSRNASDPATPGSTDKSGKEGLALKNDRAKVQNSIAGIHAIAAVLTKQPIMNLNQQEAAALTNAACDVADYHGINLISAGGAFGLYASLATCCYMIYAPRIVALKAQRVAVAQEEATRPSEAAASAEFRAGPIDYSGATFQ